MDHASRIPAWLQHPEKASGALTVAAMLVAFAMVNSPLRPLYQFVHHTPLAVRVGALLVEKPLILWINEGLMVFFFLLVALEIKREVLEGHLASLARVALPALAALGGMLAPAAIYLLFTWGDAAVTLPVVAAVLLWLLWKRAWRAAAYWLAAAGFAAALTVTLPAATRPLPLYESANALFFPSGHATMSIVSYGFLAVLIGRELSPQARPATVTAIVLLVGLIAFSRLYLGAHWLSDALAGLTFGAAWVVLLGIAYLHRPAPVLSGSGLMVVAFSALLASGGWYLAQRNGLDTLRYAVRLESRTIPESVWWTDAWQTLPAGRIDIEGEYEQPMTVQWAGSLEYLRRTLLAKGRREPAPLLGKNLLLWLDITRPDRGLPRSVAVSRAGAVPRSPAPRGSLYPLLVDVKADLFSVLQQEKAKCNGCHRTRSG